MAEAPVRLPDVAANWARVRLDDVARDDLLLALCGLYAPGARYLTAAEREAVESRGCLPDATPWDLPLCLPLPPSMATAPGERLVLVDAEGVPQAFLDVSEVAGTPRARTAAGRLQPVLEPPARLRLTDAPLAAPVVEPMDEDDVAQVAGLAGRRRSVVILALTGTGQPHTVAALTAALGDAARKLQAAVVPVPLPHHHELSETARTRLAVSVAAAMGAGEVVLPGTSWAADVRKDAPVVVHVTRTKKHAVRRRRIGLVVMFTGLSGSGKSTIARAVSHDLGTRTGRPVTLLDGDVARTMLSSELGFSREHRDLNVRRIGFVAAEVARHGGIAVVAPIAPYAATRAEVRRMVERHGEFVLVHVATPLEVCEARDRKGLYSMARAGTLQGLTGVQDPYEPPTDADLVLDTTARQVEECAAAVLQLLGQRGLSWT
ncbi:MAG TPA: adenylyl-sulfate kinase [Actinomycetales bacterium]|nr:adenylyl-sulfate kinase [Actinomycetales bacterium]